MIIDMFSHVVSVSIKLLKLIKRTNLVVETHLIITHYFDHKNIKLNKTEKNNWKHEPHVLFSSWLFSARLVILVSNKNHRNVHNRLDWIKYMCIRIR